MKIPTWLSRAMERKPDRPRVTTFEHLSDESLDNLLTETEVRMHLLDGVTNGYSREGLDAGFLLSLDPDERLKLKSETLRMLSQLRGECRRRGCLRKPVSAAFD